MNHIKLSIFSWNRFISRNLSIHPDLVGGVHEFPYEQYKVTVALPSRQHLPTEPDKENLLTFYRYKDKDGKKIPVELTVHAVDVSVRIPDEVSVPEEILNRPSNAFDIIPKEKQEHLDHLAATYETVAERAFDLWIRTLRWKCDNSTIGRPEIRGPESGWSTYLITQPHEKRIWSSSKVFYIIGTKMITPKMWQEVESSLKMKCQPPIFIDLTMDAIEHINVGDLKRAIVDMAIACESFLRMIVEKSLPNGLQVSIATYIDDANIRPVLEKFVPDILNEKERKEFNKIKSKLHELCDLRNNIVHKGQSSELTEERCNSFLRTTKRLLGLRT